VLCAVSVVVACAVAEAAVDQSHAFDFLHGEHPITLRVRTGEDEWSTLTGTIVVEPFLDGGAHREILDVVDGEGNRYTGSAVRVYHPDEGEWSVCWVDNATREFQIATGRFGEDGAGRFYCDTDGDAGDALSEWAWYPDDPEGPRFEVRRSADGGETWGEVGVVMKVRETGD